MLRFIKVESVCGVDYAISILFCKLEMLQGNKIL